MDIQALYLAERARIKKEREGNTVIRQSVSQLPSVPKTIPLPDIPTLPLPPLPTQSRRNPKRTLNIKSKRKRGVRFSKTSNVLSFAKGTIPSSPIQLNTLDKDVMDHGINWTRSFHLHLLARKSLLVFQDVKQLKIDVLSGIRITRAMLQERGHKSNGWQRFENTESNVKEADFFDMVNVENGQFKGLNLDLIHKNAQKFIGYLQGRENLPILLPDNLPLPPTPFRLPKKTLVPTVFADDFDGRLPLARLEKWLTVGQTSSGEIKVVRLVNVPGEGLKWRWV